jgi:hypothetical protein
MIHKSLFDLYVETNNLVRYHNFDAEYIDNMIPFEKELHIGLIIKDLQEKRAKLERERNSGRNNYI